MDFTKATYQILLNTLKKQGFSFLSFSEFLVGTIRRVVVLRHDVDRLPLNSLDFARIQFETGITGTYYFRAVSDSWDEKIIRQITEMGHEVGYHYEDFIFASKKIKVKSRIEAKTQSETWWGKKSKNREISDLQDFKLRHGRNPESEANRELARLQDNGRLEKELVDIAIEDFTRNLHRLRKIAPVKTICMHGSPLSKWDSQILWKYYDYRDFGIIGESYFDINFDEVLYLTDTGRRWDGESVSVRDKAQGSGLRAQGEDQFQNWKVKPVKYRKTYQDPGPSTQDPAPFPKFHSTSDIIKAAEEGRLPDKIMMTFHPQRWTEKPLPWVKELVWQNVKNIGKYFIVKLRSD